MRGEKARLELCKNAAYHFKEILEEAPHKNIRGMATYHQSHKPSK